MARFGDDCRRPCPEGWELAPENTEFECVKITRKLQWLAAESDCAATSIGPVNGMLAGPHSATQNAALRQMCTDANENGATSLCWIGANDIDVEGTWVWSDGSPSVVSTFPDVSGWSYEVRTCDGLVVVCPPPATTMRWAG